MAVLLAGMLMGGMDLTILNVALPTVSRELLPSSSELLWIMDGYALTVAATLVVCSTVGDRMRHKRIQMAGLVTFALASLVAALSTAPGRTSSRPGPFRAWATRCCCPARWSSSA